MFSISGCEAADVSSPMEMAVEVVNGNIFYNSPLQETIRIHLHYHLNINYSQTASVSAHLQSSSSPLGQQAVADVGDTTRRSLLLHQVLHLQT